HESQEDGIALTGVKLVSRGGKDLLDGLRVGDEDHGRVTRRPNGHVIPIPLRERVHPRYRSIEPIQDLHEWRGGRPGREPPNRLTAGSRYSHRAHRISEARGHSACQVVPSSRSRVNAPDASALIG